MKSRALANSFKLAKLDFHFAGTAAEQWSSFSATTWRDNNQRTSFLLVLCCIATCLTAIFLSLSFCMWIRPGRKKFNFLPRHIPKARFCFAILEFNEYLDWGFRSSRSSIRSWWMTCLVTDGCRLCATLIRLLCHLTSLFGLLPWDVKHKCNGDFVQTSDGVGWGDSKGTQIDLSEQQ